MTSIQGSAGNSNTIMQGDNTYKSQQFHTVQELKNGTRIERELDGSETRIIANSEDNDINIHKNPDGSADVTVDGETVHLSREEARNLVVEGGSGDDHISVTGYQLCGPEMNITLNGGSGDDVIRGGSGSETIDGGSGDDWIDGGAGNDHIHGGSGNDTLIGGDGNDHLYGGDGDDGIWGGAGDDRIYGENGNDTLVGNSGNDHIVGGYGDDNMWGSSGNDTLSGGMGNDNVVGGSGDDNLYGGRGDDRLWGNSGDDLLIGEHGDDYVDGGSGNNTIIDREDDFIIIDDGRGEVLKSSMDDRSGASFNPFDPLGLLTGGGPSLGGGGFPLNLISPK